MFQNIVIIYKPVDKCIEKLHSVTNILKEKRANIRVFSIDDVVRLDEKTDLVIGIGGDGTILKISRVFQDKSPLVLPIPCGRRMVFYEKFNVENLVETIEKTFKGEFRVECLRRINVKFLNKTFTVLNEALLLSVDRGKVTGFEVKIQTISKTYSYSFDGDGVLLGSTAGSTAYNLTLGGSILDSNTDSVFVTPLNPLDRSLTQITVPLFSYITTSSRGRTELYLDGEKISEIPPHTMITVYPCHHKLRLVRLGEKNYLRDIYERRRFEYK